MKTLKRTSTGWFLSTWRDMASAGIQIRGVIHGARCSDARRVEQGTLLALGTTVTGRNAGDLVGIRSTFLAR
eukprot:3181399-Rhodomonas_salina.1